jgi:hypothetical protein
MGGIGYLFHSNIAGFAAAGCLLAGCDYIITLLGGRSGSTNAGSGRSGRSKDRGPAAPKKSQGTAAGKSHSRYLGVCLNVPCWGNYLLCGRY